MHIYRFNNLPIRHSETDFLVSGYAKYDIEDFAEDGKEASFHSAELIDAIDRTGVVLSQECLKYISEAVVEHFNKDITLCRSLGWKG